jgi:hypothetical protein
MELRIGSPALPFAALHVLLQCVDIVATGAAIGAGRLRLLAGTGRARERRAGRFGGSFSFPKEVAPVLNGTSNWLPTAFATPKGLPAWEPVPSGAALPAGKGEGELKASQPISSPASSKWAHFWLDSARTRKAMHPATNLLQETTRSPNRS